MFLQWRVLLPLLDGAHKIHTMISISKLLLHSFWTCKIIPVVSLNITSSWTVRKIISHLDLYLNTCILRMEKIKGAISSGYTHHTLYMTIFKKKNKCEIFCSKTANLFHTNEEQSWMVFFKCHVYMHKKIWEKMLIVKQNTNNVCLQFVLHVCILSFTSTFFHFAFPSKKFVTFEKTLECN